MKSLSPSQLEVYKLCPRKWGFKYLQGRQEPQHESAQAGTKIHDILERYLRDGAAIDESETWKTYKIGAIAKAMTEFLPPAGSVKQTETKLEFTVDGISYNGRVDGRTADTVYDHKSTSDFKYLKDEETLETDLQALIYARWADEDCTLQWTFGRTKGAVKAKPVRLKVLRDDVRQKFNEIVQPLAREVLAAYEKNDPKSLTRNKDACRLYPPKGCPFQNDCWSVGERLRNTMAQKETLLEKLKREKLEAEAQKPGMIEQPQASAWEKGEPTFEQQVEEARDMINPPISVSTGTPTTPVVTETLPKKPRKSRKAAEPELLLTIEALPTNADIPAVSPTNDTEPAPAPDEDAKPIRTLFLNCLPMQPRADLVYAHTLIAKAAETVQNDAELPHVKLAPYGTGGGLLSAELRAQILQLVPGFDMVLMAKNPEGRDVEMTLCSLAQNVIMGV